MESIRPAEKMESHHLESKGGETPDCEPGPSDFAMVSESELESADKKILLKLDLILVPMMALLFLMGFLDRGNIGNARVLRSWSLYGFWNWMSITITYVPYIAAELPSNLLLQRLGARIVLPFLCTSWGIVTTLQSQVKNYPGLLACRFFIGLMEGGLFPGIVLYLSSFYRRHELQVRVGLFYSAASLSGAFSGLLAAAIENMDGIGGLSGWQWIFCLEGLATFLFGLISFFCLPNSPHQVRTFTPEQAKRCVERLKNDVEFPEAEEVGPKTILSVFTNHHLWLQLLTLFCSGMGLYGMAYFSPSIVDTFGFSTTKTQLMTVPPFISAFLFTMISSYLADRYRQRGIAALSMWMVALIGIILFYKTHTVALRYLSLFFLVSGLYAVAPCLIAWVPNNSAAHIRRATSIAAAFICINAGGIVSTWIFPDSQAPNYPLASKMILGAVVVGIASTMATRFQLKRCNEKKRNPEYRQKLLGTVEHLTPAQQMAALGDLHPDFVYTY